MKTVFELAARPFADRIEVYKKINSEFCAIDMDRVATLDDLEDCFFENSIEARGFTGERYLLNKDRLTATLQKSVDNGMFVGDIPVSLAKSKTQQLLRRKILGHMAASRFRDGDLDAEDVQAEYEQLVKAAPDRLQIVYVGDYLDHVDRMMSLKVMTTLDVIAGRSKPVVDMISDLKKLPDYREYAINRPPRNGSGTKRDNKPRFDHALAPVL